MSPLLATWQASSSAPNSTPREPFQEFRRLSWHVWSLSLLIMRCWRIPLPRMQWSLPRFIVGGMRKSPGLIQRWGTQTLHVATSQWLMYYLNDCYCCWHCASGSDKDFLLPCSNHIPLEDLNRLYLWFPNTVTYSDPENGSLEMSQEPVYMPHKHSWSEFKVPFVFNHRLGDQFRSASFNSQRLKLWIVSTGHTCMAYDKWKWKMDHWLIKSTRHSLPSPQQPSTIVCWPGKQVSWGSRQSLVQEVEHNVYAIQETIIMRLIMHGQMYFVVLTRIFVLPGWRFKTKWLTISGLWSAEGSSKLVRTQRWHNLTTIRVTLMSTALIMSWRSW